MIERIIDQRRRDLGGFEVGRVLPYGGGQMVGPFIFFDHMGPVSFQPGFPRTVDVRPHPHIGLSTVTYLFEGSITHRDSVGSTEIIHPGEVNWMTAGKGITHSERFEDLRAKGGAMHGIQAWVALPEADEETDPGFWHHGPDDLPTYESPDGKLWARLVAGKAFGVEAKVKTHSPLFYIHWRLKAGGQADLGPEYSERAAYVAQGAVEVGGQTLHVGQMAILAPGQHALFTAQSDAIVMLLGGEPLGKRFIEWNFVSASKDRIEQAKADWRAGRMKLPDADDQEFTPLPGDPPPPAPPMS